MMTIITTTTMATTITMTDAQQGRALLRLLAWLSPVFPVGGFSYSNGLERAVHNGLVRNREELFDWLSQLVAFGSGWNDAVLLAEAWRRALAEENIDDLAELGEALAGSRERHMETMLQGRAFLDAAKAWPHPLLEKLPDDCPYPIAVGAVAGAHGIALADALGAWLHAYVSNLVQAAIRLGITGQSGGVETLAALEAQILETAQRAAKSTLDDLGSSTIMADIMAMRHETQNSRLFRT
ncbi:urease accessory protein UreF [Mesorhizobium soli]|uniref:Urease accessory protein UreF n=2 Tax=Pseudaminobacter soli (ex Li et al. 2025) TaxID=1295366 RepID=A0A2P7SIP0_9HYPH|nr:urease accessory protein UreF [Mesorhizobium soli]